MAPAAIGRVIEVGKIFIERLITMDNVIDE